ncbi:hypothetical protein SLE2022_397710 [Rubroshorea leprosula]
MSRLRCHETGYLILLHQFSGGLGCEGSVGKACDLWKTYRCFLTEEKRWSETPLENLFPIQAVKSKAGTLKDTGTRNLTKIVGCGKVLKFSYNAEESKWLSVV